MNIVNKNPETPSSILEPLRPEALEFVQAFAALLEPWGLPPSAGRVFGYLLLIQHPVSVDQIAVALDMSRVGAWNAAKSLERFGHVRRFTVAGSKRAYYQPSSDFSEPLLKQAALISTIGGLLENCAESIAAEDAVLALQQRASFYSSLAQDMEATIRALNNARQRATDAGADQ